MAQYKSTIVAGHFINWTTSGGSSVGVQIDLRLEESDYYGDGVWQPTRNALSTVTTTLIEGKEQQSSAWVIPCSAPNGIVARIANLGLTQDILDQVNAAYRAIEAHPLVIERQATLDQAEAASKQYRADTARVEFALTLGGATY